MPVKSVGANAFARLDGGHLMAYGGMPGGGGVGACDSVTLIDRLDRAVGAGPL